VRVLVVGTLPPPGGAAARELADLAATRQAAGDEVELLSPDPASSAHRTRRLDGLFLAVELAWLSRRFDALVLRIEEDLPCGRDTGRVARAVVLGALGAAVSRYAEVTLRLDSPVPIPGGVGGRAARALWAAADAIVVRAAADRDELVPAPGVHPDRIVIEEHPPSLSAGVPQWPESTDPELQTAVLEVVRTRAARDRAAVAARATLSVPATGGPRRSQTRVLGVTKLLARHAGHRAVGSARRVAGAVVESHRGQRSS